jgi:HEAT repeat protein
VIVKKGLPKRLKKPLQGVVSSFLIGLSVNVSLGLAPFSDHAFAQTPQPEAEPLETWINAALDDGHRLHLQALKQLQQEKNLPVTVYPRLVPLLFSDRLENIQASLVLFHTKSAEKAWPEVVHSLQADPGPASAPLSVLLHWKNTEAIRQLASWASSESHRQRFLYAHLFGQHPMSPEDIPLLKPLLTDPREDVQIAAILGLLPTGDSEAWQAFESRLSDPEHHERIIMPFHFQISRGLRIPLAIPPCLPPVAFLKADQWFSEEISMRSEFTSWFNQSPPHLLWNGKNCGDYQSLNRKTQIQLRDALYTLLQHPDISVRQRARDYLKAWLGES